MAAYLATRRHHKFPPLLLVGYQRWVYEHRNDKWGTDASAMDGSLTLSGLEPTGTYWDLEDTETEFLRTGRPAEPTDGHPWSARTDSNRPAACPRREAQSQKERSSSREEIVDHIHNGTGTPRATLPSTRDSNTLMDERIGVEIVPAVCSGETYDEALRRLRQMFVLTLTRTPRRITRSESAQLDETNRLSRRLPKTTSRPRAACAAGITADGEPRGSKVDATTKLLSPRVPNCYTTLEHARRDRQALPEGKQNSSRNQQLRFLGQRPLVAKGIFVRVQKIGHSSGARMTMVEYFDQLKAIPSHVAFIQGKPASELTQTRHGRQHPLSPYLVQTNNGACGGPEASSRPAGCP